MWHIVGCVSLEELKATHFLLKFSTDNLQSQISGTTTGVLGNVVVESSHAW